MLDLVRLATGVALVLLLPASILLVLFVPRGQRFVMLPASFAGAIACNLLSAQVLDLLGIAVTTWSVGLSYIVVAGLLVRLAPRRADKKLHQGERVSRSSAVSIAVAACLAVVAFGVAFSVAGATPPFQDSAHHGFMVRQIVVHGTVDSKTVASLDAAGAEVSANYYPLGMHLTAALAHRSTGAPIDLLLAAFSVFAAAVILPIGVFAYSRLLLSDEVAAAAATVLAVAHSAFPYVPYTWGGVPTVFGTSLAAGVAVALVRAASSGGVRLIAFAALALTGTFFVTNSAVFLPVLLALAAAFARPRSQGLAGIRQRTLRLAAAGAASLAMLAPTLGELRLGLREREGLVRTITGSRTQVLVDLALGRLEVGYPEFAWVGLVALGFLVLLCRRSFGLVVVSGILVALVLIAWSPTDGPLTGLVQPWYGSAYRVGYLLAVPAAVSGGVGVSWLLNRHRVASARRKLPIGSGLGIVAGLCLLSVTFVALRTGREMITTVDRGTVLPRGADRAFEYLSTRATGTVVLGEYCDQSTWMYALQGVAPLFGVLTPDPEGNPEQERRVSTVRAVSDGDLDPRSLDVVQELDIDFVYFGEGSQCPDGERLMQLADLRSNPWLHEVLDVSGAHVFEMIPIDESD